MPIKIDIPFCYFFFLILEPWVSNLDLRKTAWGDQKSFIKAIKSLNYL